MVAGQTTQYQYNGRGERVEKIGASTTVFVYDEAGHLLGEYASDGSVQAEYVWLGDLPIATRTAANTIAYIEPDHLGTPRAVIDPLRDLAIWQWPLLANAFGDAAPLTDPDGDGVAFVMNLRFPGQYFDGETGLHYNYFRDYDPGAGRYVESDPIGMRGGASTYGYGLNRPFNFIDPLGLYVKCRTEMQPVAEFNLVTHQVEVIGFAPVRKCRNFPDLPDATCIGGCNDLLNRCLFAIDVLPQVSAGVCFFLGGGPRAVGLVGGGLCSAMSSAVDINVGYEGCRRGFSNCVKKCDNCNN